MTSRSRQAAYSEELAGGFFQPAILCSMHHETLSVADFIMQVIPDIRFQLTDSDDPFLSLPQPLVHALRSLLPAVTFFFFTGTFFSLVLNTVGVRGTTPALLFDKTDWQGAVGGVHQDRVSQQLVRLRVSGGIPQVIRCRTVAEVNGGGVFQREEQRMSLTCPCSGGKSVSDSPEPY